MTVEILKKNLIKTAIVIIVVILIGVFLFVNRKNIFSSIQLSFSKQLSSQEAGQKAIDYINKNLLRGKKNASLVSIAEESGVYKFRLKIDEQEYTSYVTKDGKLLFPNEGINLDSTSTQEVTKEETTQEISKSEIPSIKLFVMSYCPYGLQAEKMFLPVYNLLKDKTDMGVYFVNYIMHGKKELDENLRQYCIQKEEKEKYYNYLNCFVRAGEFEKCLKEAEIDLEKMNSCISKTDEEYKITKLYNDQNTWLNGQFPRFDVHNDLNEKYKVAGSPTVVVNGRVVIVNPRSPERFKEVVCQAFNSPPEECKQKLSEESFSPGFGLKTDSSGGSGQCE